MKIGDERKCTETHSTTISERFYNRKVVQGSSTIWYPDFYLYNIFGNNFDQN